MIVHLSVLAPVPVQVGVGEGTHMDPDMDKEGQVWIVPKLEKNL
jgi:hypothetical protein